MKKSKHKKIHYRIQKIFTKVKKKVIVVERSPKSKHHFFTAKLEKGRKARNENHYEKGTDILIAIRKAVIEVLKPFKITFKDTYYKSYPNKKYVKFYKVDNKGKNNLSALVEKLYKIPHVVASEIKINNKNEVSLFVYNQLGTIKEPTIKFNSEETKKEVTLKKTLWPTGVAKEKNQQDLIKILDTGLPYKTIKGAIEDFMPDEVIKRVLDEDKDYYPIVINLAGERCIKWKTYKA